MFSWLKKKDMAAHAVEPRVGASRGGAPAVPPATDSEALKNQGNAFFSCGNLEDAAACYRRAIECNPHYAEAYTNLGNVSYAQGHSGEAIALFRKAIEYKPTLLPAHQNLGIALLDIGHNDQAEECFRQVIAMAPDNSAATQSLGVIAAERGDLSQAEILLRRAIELQADYAEAHNNLGSLLQLTNRLGEAEVFCRRAVELKPDYAEAHFNLGNTLKDIGRLEEAAQSYRRALAAKPDFADAHCNLGVVLKESRQPEEAEACYRHALQIKPDHALVYNNMGNLLSVGRPDEAEACYRHALRIKPDFAEVYGNLGNLLKSQHRLDEALACFQQQGRLTPDNPEAQHNIASLAGNNPERAPAEYVEKYFDGYADDFDAHLVEVLKYETPEKLVALINQHATMPGERWKVLDLGCGTGLAGLAIAPFAQQLVGVDLSAKMLEKATARNLYQRLECMDLLTMMRDEKAGSYDVIIAADVFIYLGRLDEIVCEIKRLLRPGGMLAFSVEALGSFSGSDATQGGGQEYLLEVTGRYSHSASYLLGLASANGFRPQAMEVTPLRMEDSKPVSGVLVAWES